MARPMLKQMEILRLILTTRLSDRDVAGAVRVSRTTVTRYRKITAEKQLTWDVLRDLSPAKLDATFNKPHRGNKIKAPVDYAVLDDFLTAHVMTLQVWWETIYRPEHSPIHRSYSNISAGLRRYRATKPSVMYQHHVPGQKVFVDFTGTRPHYIDPATRQRVHVEVFVGTLGASNYTYATALPSQSVPDFIRAHAQMFDFFGGVPDMVVPDNLKSAMTKAGPDGEIQRSYDDLTRHYGVVALAARPYKPKDKSKVERQVGILTERILARLRTFTFYSIDELNVQLAVFLDEENNRSMANGMPSRRQRFDNIERTALRPLPPTPYEYAAIKPHLRVDAGYHILVDYHRYSVPHTLVGQRVDARITDTHIELFHEGRTVARHTRSHDVGGLTTHPSHQPDHHRAQAERTPEALRAWAKLAGPAIHRFVEKQFNQDRPYLGLRPADKLKTLAGKYGSATVEQALASYSDLSHVTVSDLSRKLSIQAKEGASTVRRSRNAGGSRSFNDVRFPHASPSPRVP